MNEALKALKKRVKSFSWRLGGMIVASVIGFIIQPEVASELKLPAIVVMIGGLVVGEITKALNSSRS